MHNTGMMFVSGAEPRPVCHPARPNCCPAWLLVSLLKGFDLLFNCYLLAVLLLATYFSALLCQNVGSRHRPNIMDKRHCYHF